jgi:replicative DNA helicase
MEMTRADPQVQQAFLSCLMQWPDNSWPVAKAYGIDANDFQGPNRVLFTFLEKTPTDHGLDLIGMTAMLRDLRMLKGAGDASYVTQTWTSVHSPDVTGYYANLIADARRRRLIAIACSEVLKRSQDPTEESVNVAHDAVQEFTKFETGIRELPSIKEAVHEKIVRIERGETAKGIVHTGLTRLDQHSPLRKGDMPVICGERKVGKSIAALSIVTNVACAGMPVAYFSLEDREPKVIDRLFCAMGRIPLPAHISDNADALMRTAARLAELPLYIYDDIFDLAIIDFSIRDLVRNHKLGLAVVDYAQLVRSPERKDVNREQKVAEVSRTLRLLAMELDIPIIVLSQLNVDGYTRESRALEQDSTACWMIAEDSDDKNVRLIRIPWQRNGPSGVSFKVTFLGELARMENYQPNADER